MSNVELQGDSNPPAGSSIPEKQEDTRGWLAKGVFILLSLFVFAIFLAVVFLDITQEKLTILLSVFSGITGILGFVMGFYFGQNQK
jgi:hypothetical protein